MSEPNPIATAAAEHEYLFDVKLFAALRIKATSKREARRLLTESLESATIHCGELPDSSPLIAEAEVDGELELLEVDGECP